MKIRELIMGGFTLTTDIVSVGCYIGRCSCGWTTRPTYRETAELGVESHLRHRHNDLKIGYTP